jgi:hypothetical protein
MGNAIGAAELDNKMNTTHLNALQLNLSNEKSRLAVAKNQAERELRTVWVAQLEKEIVAERAFLGMDDEESKEVLSDDDLLNELLA